MKKIIAMLLVLSVIIETVPAFAETNTEKLEKIILSVKDRVGILDEYSEFSTTERQGADGSVTYSLHWSDNKDGYKSEYVSVAADGVIISYSKSAKYNGETGPKIRNVNRTEIMEKAQQLVNDFNPSLRGQLFLKDNSTTNSLWDLSHSFEIERVVNGFVVPESGGSVTVDESGEHITYFYLNHYQNSEFENEAIIDHYTAQKAFGEKTGIVLEYYKNNSDESNKAVPVYLFKDIQTKISAVDASTFVPVKTYNGVLYEGKSENVTTDKATPSVNASGGASLSKTELSELDKISGLISKDEAIKLIFDNPYIAIDSSSPLMNYNVYKAGEDSYVGRFYFGEEYSQVALNMKTGEVKYFYIYKFSENDTKAVTEESAKALASDGAAYLAGEKFKEYKYDESSKSYTRYVNDIPFRQDRIDISVNEELGIINAYSINYSDCEFQSLHNVIAPNMALKVLFSEMPYNVVYERHVEDDKTVFKLIYDFETTYMRMDAFTGEIFGISDEEKLFEGYTDISGHWAEDIINTLALYGIHTQGREFTPDKEITQSDFAKLLSCIVRNIGVILLKSEVGDASEWLTDNGIVKKDEYVKDAPVPRLEAAKMMVHAIGGKEFAELDGIYNCPFADVTDSVGYVSILYGMGVFKGDGTGNFNPQKNITYAEAAVIIYNYLVR